jgi:ATP-dependent RNA helicase DDX24/MAK5
MEFIREDSPLCCSFCSFLTDAFLFIKQLSSGNHPHLNDLSQLRFLAIDEADRMTQQGGFPQLYSILDAVQKANPMDDDESDDEEDESDDDEAEDPDRMFGLPGIRGEARLEMLSDDIMQQLEEQRRKKNGDAKETPEDADQEDQQEGNGEEEDDEEDNDEISLPLLPPVHRQTFIYSATLTLPASSSFVKSSKKRKNAPTDDVDGALAEILEKSRAKGRTKIIDLSHNGSNKPTEKKGKKETKEKRDDPSKPEKQFRLPPGLRLSEIMCTKMHKDSHLYAYLMTTVDGKSGPCLVFCNSIAAVRRVGDTLETLGIEVQILHANMQQVSFVGLAAARCMYAFLR